MTNISLSSSNLIIFFLLVIYFIGNFLFNFESERKISRLTGYKNHSINIYLLVILFIYYISFSYSYINYEYIKNKKLYILIIILDIIIILFLLKYKSSYTPNKPKKILLLMYLIFPIFLGLTFGFITKLNLFKCIYNYNKVTDILNSIFYFGIPLIFFFLTIQDYNHYNKFNEKIARIRFYNSNKDVIGKIIAEKNDDIFIEIDECVFLNKNDDYINVFKGLYRFKKSDIFYIYTNQD